MKRNNKGFTLAEMLIVVAIIGILIAILVPIFSGSLNKTRLRTDEANIRTAYGEVLSYVIENDAAAIIEVKLKSTDHDYLQVTGVKVGTYSGMTIIAGEDGNKLAASGANYIYVKGNTDGTVVYEPTTDQQTYTLLKQYK